MIGYGLIALTLTVSILKVILLRRQYSVLREGQKAQNLKRQIIREGGMACLVCVLLLLAMNFQTEVTGLEAYLWVFGPLAIFSMVWISVAVMPFRRGGQMSDWRPRADIADSEYPVFENAQDDHANARAYGGFGYAFILCTKGLSQALNTAQLQGVLAHEAGHLKHYHHAKLTLFLGGMYSALFSLLLVLMEGEGLLIVLLYAGLGSWSVKSLAQPFVSALCRYFEFQADDYAAKRCGATPFADTLKEIWAANPAGQDDPLYALWFNGHPDPHDRLARLAQHDIEARAVSPV